MRPEDLSVGEDEEDLFREVRGGILAMVGAHARGARPDDDLDEVLGQAGVVLDYKWQYSDGELGSWEIGEVGEFLLHWCPGKLSGSGAEWAGLPAAFDLLVETLAVDDMIDTPGTTVEGLRREIARCGAQFEAAMDDRSRWGMAKSIVGSITDGFGDDDELDPAELMARFNALPDEQRRAVTDRLVRGPGRPAVPPVVLPPDAVVEASAAAAPVVAKLRAIADFYGAGRVAVRDLLVAEGYDAPATEARFTDAPLVDLLQAMADDNSDGDGHLGDGVVIDDEIDGWLAARTAAEVLAEVRAVVGSDAHPSLWAEALRMFVTKVPGVGDAEMGEEFRGYVVGLRTDADPTLRALGRWFATAEMDDRLDAGGVPGDDVADLHYFGYCIADNAIPLDDIAEGFADPDALIALTGAAWRDPSPMTEYVLELMAEAYPDKAVAKAARKALFKRRTAGV